MGLLGMVLGTNFLCWVCMFVIFASMQLAGGYFLTIQQIDRATDHSPSKIPWRITSISRVHCTSAKGPPRWTQRERSWEAWLQLVALLGPSWKLVFAYAIPGVQKLSSPPCNSPCLLISWFWAQLSLPLEVSLPPLHLWLSPLLSQYTSQLYTFDFICEIFLLVAFPKRLLRASERQHRLFFALAEGHRR